ncbi:hypothetical protein [Ruania alba]|uniref:Uncharacterized protein n=1 Tax=Ruania alba TaxID=648782 RepID=A0A1H5HWN3_9MICO|nr:hypothetical protein [Ruania alba]SEE32071.1 hypothetical protein SAMN04488554_2083 [Ruania alba]
MPTRDHSAVLISLGALILFVGGGIAGGVAALTADARHHLLVSGSGGTAPILAIALVGAVLLTALWVFSAHLLAHAMTPNLDRPPLQSLFDGALCLGLALGLGLFSLRAMLQDTPIVVGRTVSEPWTGVQWVAYLAPAALQVALVATGLVLVLRGRHGIGQCRAHLREVGRRYRLGSGPAGVRLTGQIVAAHAAGQDHASTRLVAQVHAPDGPLMVESTAPGSDRGWLPRSHAQVYLAVSAQHDPAHTLIEVRDFPRRKFFLATAVLPPGQGPHSGRLDG